MADTKIKSTAHLINQIDWNHQIVIKELAVHPDVLNMHKQRIKTLYKNESEAEQEEKVKLIVLRENLLNEIVSYLVSCFEFNINDEDIKIVLQNIDSTYGKREGNAELASNIVKKGLVFAYIQKEQNINVSDDEIDNILNNYYASTNQPIRQFVSNPDQKEHAKRILIEEKIVTFLIDKFPRDLSAITIKKD